MQEESMLKKILKKIKKFLLIIFLIIGDFFRSLFGSSKKDIKKANQQKQTEQVKPEDKKETPITSTPATLPDEDNIKVNPHNNKISDQEDTNPSSDVVLEIPKQTLYKVYTKDNELKYLPLDALLDLIIKEELERIYKVENFKLKKATTREIIKVEQIKERILPEIIVRVEKETLRTAEVIREEVVIKLEEDLIKNPIFPPRQKKEEIYSLAKPEKKDIKLKPISIPKISKANKQTISDEQKIIVDNKLESTSSKVIMVKKVEEIPTPTKEENIKDIATIAAVSSAAIISELIPSNPEEKKDKEEKEEETEILDKTSSPKEEIKIEEKIELPKEKEPEIIEQPEELEEIQEIKKEELLDKKEIKEEIKKLEEKNKEELEELKKQIEEKIEELKKEKKEEEKQKDKEEKEEQTIKDIKQEKEINEMTEVSEEVISESKDEISKSDFFEKDYERIERQIDKMLEDLTNTYLKYEKKLSDKQKKKLKNEERRLRETKENIKYQKSLDIQVEQQQLEETIKESELAGLQSELQFIHEQNKQEVSDGLLEKMKNFEGITREQVANVDKRIMLKRFNKANILLEMTSLLALPFVRNKYFFYFTVGLVIDNHFNFVNAFFNRKFNRYEPADLSQIKQGQDALNGALDITYKNLVELEYLEQRALSRYPELSYDPRFINQVTRLRTNLNKKYNNLMNKNKTLEKYRLKTKKHKKILKKENENTQQ